MGEKRILSSATARVELVIEVAAGSSWGPDCCLDQIYRQGGEGARNRVEDALRKAGIGVRILSSKVTAVSAVEGGRND